jgi:hypothetical protein
LNLTSNVLRKSFRLRNTCLAIFILSPTMGMLRISAFDRYFMGRGMKPDSARMSKKDVWLGTYITASSSGGKLSTPYRRSGLKVQRREACAQKWMSQSTARRRCRWGG